MYKIIKTLMYDRVHKGSYICDAQRKGWGLGGGGGGGGGRDKMGWGGGGGLEICHVFEDSVVFKQCMFFIFADGGHRIGHVL